MGMKKDHYGFDIKRITNLNEIEKDNSFHYIYQVDHQQIRHIDATDNLLFLGSSGGGFPAIKHAGVFKMKALISNSQLILTTYPYFKEFTATLSENNDMIAESPDIRETLSKQTHPSRIILYINELDNPNLKDNAAKLSLYLEENDISEILDYHPFKKDAPPGKTPHHVQWDCKLDDLIKKVLNIHQ